MAEVIYRVKRPFQAGDKQYRPGDVYEPTGARNDKAILEHFCRVENKPPAKVEVNVVINTTADPEEVAEVIARKVKRDTRGKL